MSSSFHSLEVLTSSDQVLYNKFGRGQSSPPTITIIHHAFESIVDQQPNVSAVEHDGGTLTYHELENASNRLASSLVEMGLKPQQRVCLVVQRSLPMVIAMLAILKCGCMFVPLDGQVITDVMLQHVIHDTQAAFVLCLDRFRKKVQCLANHFMKLVVLDTAFDDLRSPVRPNVEMDKSNGAYLIYTSGIYRNLKGQLIQSLTYIRNNWTS